jgi:hypothetical protein
METVIIAIPRPKFSLGQIVITANAQATLDQADVQKGLARHAAGDWGEVCPEDAASNDHGSKRGGMILSAYRSREELFWIITDAGHGVTTVLMPEDY